jgi:hypothetical protein
VIIAKRKSSDKNGAIMTDMNRRLRIGLPSFATLLLFLCVASAAGPRDAAPNNDEENQTVLYMPRITSSITPPATNGWSGSWWNNTSVTVHFAVTNVAIPSYEIPPDFEVPKFHYDPRTVKITPDVVLTNEMEVHTVIGVAMDAEGNTLTNVEYVSIDRTPPKLKMEAGNDGVFDDSYPLLVVNYSDLAGATKAGTSEINVKSFWTALDGVTVTNVFYKFTGQAFAFLKHLGAGPHLWVASIADHAGNVTTVTNLFIATGTINSNAPTMSNIDLTDNVTITPDMSEIWVQGKVTGRDTTVSAFNNDGVEPMNRLHDDFGYFIHLDDGTNALVLVASDATSKNRSAKLFKVVRSDSYKAEVKLPAPKYYERFKNGEPQSVTGVVSREFDDGQTPLPTLVSVSVNGIAASLLDVTPDKLVNWTGVTLPSPGCSNPVVPIILSICWAGPTSSGTSRKICVNVPMDFMEGYEIVQKKSSYTESWVTGKYPSQMFEQTNGCDAGKCIVDKYSYTSNYEFGMPCGGAANSVWNYLGSGWQRSCLVPDADLFSAQSDMKHQNETMDRVAQPNRGLAFGSRRWQNQYTRYDTGDGVAYQDGYELVADGSMTIRTPFNNKKPYQNLFTFKGVEGDMPLSELKFEGNLPLVVNEKERNVSYILELDGATEYTISADSFTWPGCGTNVVKKYKTADEVTSGKHTETYTEQSHFFRFTDFGQ